MLGSSTTVFVTRTVIEIVNQGDYIVLGVIASKSAVGLYFFAFRFSVQPIRMLFGNFINVLLPVLADPIDQPQRQIDAIIRACRLLSCLVVPFCFLQAALAGPGLQLLFGHRWQDAIPLVQLLSIGLPFDAVSWITGSLLSARREFSRALRFAAVSAPLFFGMVIGGPWLHGLIGVATAVVAYYVIYPPICSILILCPNDLRITTILELYFMPVLLAGFAIDAVYLTSLTPLLVGHNLLRIVVICALSGLLHPAALAVGRRDMLNEILRRFEDPLRRLPTQERWLSAN